VRAAVVVPAAEAETAAARLLELVPAGHEVENAGDTVELAVYVPAAELERLRAAFPAVRTEPVAPGWEDEWRRFHVPVVVGPLWVGPPWETPPADLQAVVIDPGRAFGTGAHPTTRLCLELLAGLERGSVLDVGCGSGVLAIAAARLGFTPVLAVDSDETAVAATVENAARNGVRIVARALDALADPLPPADVVVANIALDVVNALAPRLQCERLVLSGYLEADRPALPGHHHLRRGTAAGWAADLYRPE
jgi:ribosomal protein L11 methyltransferase